MDKQLVSDVKKIYIKKFGEDPFLIFSPGRINIIGEHTDYNDGFVFPGAVNKGIYAAIQKANTNKCTAFALDKNDKLEFNLNAVKPMKEGSWQNYVLGIVAEIQKTNKIIGNFNIVFKGDIPGGAGMSSSAALENSIVFGLNKIFDLNLTKEEMILISQKAEHNYVGVNCGIMDQYASMFGVKNHALLLDCRSIKAKPFKIDFKEYDLVLINTNVKHSLSDSAYNDRRSACENIAKRLKISALRDANESDLKAIKNLVTPENYNKALFVIQENQRAIKASKAMLDNDIKTLGKLIYSSHNGLSKQYKVSCDELDFLVDKARSTKYVIGARMMGGGFGGCTINLIHKHSVDAFKNFVETDYKNTFGKACSFYSVTLSNGTHLIN
ncbi:galactokinase [Tamlana sedimentorum]|uniref:Galactokinase n=1 Tax=Neotamlana sedimentorum TaxID=1435349 RepID=A0A0D7WB54_9FLAO|nr:galactokinase [Tamlana sedimentorum]KJD36346.1 galactokinase [Tamlana sedimentorum]